MSNTLRAFVLVCATTLAGTALAQEDGAEADAEAEAETGGSALSMGEEATPQIGDAYVAETHGEWSINCIKTEQDKDPCQMYQLMKDAEDNPVAEITVFDVPNGQQAVAGATVVTPLGTLLTSEVTVQIDEGKAKRYPFSWCDQAGCISRIGLTGKELLSLQNGKQIVVTIRAVQSPEQKIDLTVSLDGFSAGFKAVAVPNSN